MTDKAEERGAVMVIPISEREFDIYSLSLPTGPNYGDLVFGAGWKAKDGATVGAVFFDIGTRNFSFLLLRRQIGICQVV